MAWSSGEDAENVWRVCPVSASSNSPRWSAWLTGSSTPPRTGAGASPGASSAKGSDPGVASFASSKTLSQRTAPVAAFRAAAAPRLSQK